MNKLILIGNLTRDPELSQLPSGVTVCKISIAVNRNFTNADGVREVDFFNITAWRGLGENCAKYLSKGKKIAVTGSVQMRSYEDRDGIKRTAVEVIAEDVEFLTPKDNGAAEGVSQSQTSAQKPKKKTAEELRPIESEDLPF